MASSPPPASRARAAAITCQPSPIELFLPSITCTGIGLSCAARLADSIVPLIALLMVIARIWLAPPAAARR